MLQQLAKPQYVHNQIKFGGLMTIKISFLIKSILLTDWNSAAVSEVMGLLSQKPNCWRHKFPANPATNHSATTCFHRAC